MVFIQHTLKHLIDFNLIKTFKCELDIKDIVRTLMKIVNWYISDKLIYMNKVLRYNQLVFI